jgi:hypothetical protein
MGCHRSFRDDEKDRAFGVTVTVTGTVTVPVSFMESRSGLKQQSKLEV